MAGVPFEPVERLGTLATSAAARELLAKQQEFEKAKSEVEQILHARRHNLPKEMFRVWRRAIRSGTMPAILDPPSRAFAICCECASKLASAEKHFDETLRRELEIARNALHKSARAILLPYLVFASEGLYERLSRQISSIVAAPPARNKNERAHERTILLYLQRICAKNDSLSAFGPCGWGKIDQQISGIALAAASGIARRECFLERWTAHGAASALNTDPDIRAELSPRIHPNGRLDGDRFVFTETGETISFDQQTIALLARCNGKTPAHSLGVAIELLEELARRNIVRWEAEVPALEPYAFNILVSDVLQWRDTPARKRWLDLLQPIAGLPAKFAGAGETISRVRIMDEACKRLEQLGSARKSSGRFLYAATNPICEECFRECGFSINENFINEIAIDAAPWIDLWRDNYAFVAGRVATGLRQVLEKMSILPDGAAPLPAFLQACETANLALTGPGLVGLAHRAFQEVKSAFRERIKPHADKPEYELTTDDCHFLRDAFEFERFDEYTYPSADLQLAAKSIEAVACGDYQWIVAELHPPVALLHHGFYWSCPDKTELSRALAATIFGQPNFHFGIFAADFTATTTVHLFDAPPGYCHFVAPQRSHPNWPAVRPAETEVYVDQTSGDVCLRKIETREYLGSFARNWIIPLGFHPFQFGMAPHMPRLRCGKIIVQRRSWTITVDEIGKGNFTGVSRDLVLAIERLRAQRDLPRFVYIRPTEQALRRSGAEGRDKDTKPVFVDLESYLFLEIFHRWLTKSGEIEATEMLPDPDHLLWKEADGRRTFELRTLIIPRP